VAPIIEVDDLVKRYRKATTNAVDGISFSVDQGQLFALLGPNGAGKTTTISILTTTLAATAGRVLLAGYDVHRQSSAVRQQVGIIFQRPSLDRNLTAEQNIRFHAILYGLYPFRFTFRGMPKEYRRAVLDLAAVVDLQDDLGKPVKTYSGGMIRKLEIIRSLIHRPKVLFLDEPTIGLDPASRRNLWEYLLGVRNEYGTTVFLTTHYLEEAEQAHNVCIMNKGRIVARGTPADLRSTLLEDYLLVDADDRPALRAELRQLGVPFTEAPLFRISPGPGGSHRLLKSIQTPLTTLRTYSPTLEDAYLAIVGGPEAEDDVAAA
jgi:ABC-2 type transport system ATP-binding protein